MTTIETDGGFLRVQGTEADLCRLIAQRQAVGIAKYGTTLRDNPLSLREWHQHHLEELLDAAAYVMRILEHMDKAQPEHGLDKVIEPRQGNTVFGPEDYQRVVAGCQRAIAERDREVEAQFKVANMWRPYDGEDDGR